MKAHNYSSRSAILLLVVSLFLVRLSPVRQPLPIHGHLHAAAPSQAPARLIIRRMPNLGFNVILQLWIDDQQTATLGYGHTYNGTKARPARFSGAGDPVALADSVGNGFECAKRADLYHTAQGSPSGNLVLASGF